VPSGNGRFAFAITGWTRREQQFEFEGLRTTLPRHIAPGEILCLPCFLRAPETAGEFKVVWTLVQEEVAWFDERNTASRWECRVEVA
jgi:hypothetical protein